MFPVSISAAVCRSFACSLALGLAATCFATNFNARDNENGNSDAAILTFSTVGDSRQDPVKPDPTSVPLSGQDALWLQNTKALTRILRSVQSQGSSFLFFNGDMIMGYGKASVPANTTTTAPAPTP